MDAFIGSNRKTSIRQKSVEETIQSLTLAIDNMKPEAIQTQIHLHLRRSYHNYKLATDTALESALDDVFFVIDREGNRFQPYLLGALILFEMKRWDQSLKMFELSIRINANLFQLLANKLIYLKFKILTERGFDEEVSFKCAMTYRFLSECAQNVNNTDKDDSNLDIEELLGIKDNMDPIAHLMRPKVNANKALDSTPHTFDSFVSKLFSSGDQKMIHKNEPINKFVLKPVNNPSKPVLVSEDEDNQSIDLEFKEILKEESEPAKEDIRNSDSIQSWIDTNFRSDSVSKMCSFDDNEEPAKRSVAKGEPHVSDTCSVTSRRSSSELKQRVHQPATNLFKLRGVYLGNLKLNCNHKVLKDMFKVYGTIVEMYQPSGADYAFIHYSLHESATNMLNDWKYRPIDQCKDGKALVVRFTASQEQMKKFNLMSYSDYKKRCNENHECERWRSGQICPYDRDCPFKHIYFNRAVDTLPDKRKANWRCI